MGTLVKLAIPIIHRAVILTKATNVRIGLANLPTQHYPMNQKDIGALQRVIRTILIHLIKVSMILYAEELLELSALSKTRIRYVTRSSITHVQIG